MRTRERASISFLIFLQGAFLLGQQIFQAANSLNPPCSGRRWSRIEIRLKSGRMALFTKFLTYHRSRSTPGQLEFTVASFQHGLQKKRFCFSAIFLYRNQGEVGEEVPCSGPRAVEPSYLEVKADTESDLLSSTSHFSELCLLGPFRGQSACRQRGVFVVLWTHCHTCHTYTGKERREGGKRMPSKTRANDQSLGAATALPQDRAECTLQKPR